MRTATVLALACAAAPLPGSALASGGLRPGDSLLVAGPALAGGQATFTGIAGGSAKRPVVAIQMAQSDGTWRTIARARAAGDGTFTASWRTGDPGRYRVRVLAATGGGAPATATLTVMRRTVATWYDQSGSTTACNVRLARGTLGVAHRSLPCGTLLEFAYRGRSVTVPVIDRGPFRKGVSYDLTIAAARRLDFVATGIGTVGVLEARTPITAPAPAPSLRSGRRG